MWTLPQTFLAQLVFFILVMTGWFQAWANLVRPIRWIPLWLFFCLEIMGSFIVLPLGEKGTLYVGGLLLPLFLVLFFSHHWYGLWYPVTSIVLLTAVLLFIREFIRYSPVFWIMDEAWGISLLALVLAFAVGRHLGESWLVLTFGLTLTEAGFLILHAMHLQHVEIGGPWFQGLWWRTLWLGAVATALWQTVPPLLKNYVGARWLAALLLRKAAYRK